MKPRLSRLLFVAGLLLLGVLVVACGDDGNDEDAINGITVEDLTGTWRAIEPGSYVQLNADGTYRIALSIAGLEDSPVEEGDWTLEGTLFTFISKEDSQNCAAGQRGSSELEVVEDGPSGEDRIRQIQVQDECLTRGSEGDVTLERVP